MGSFYGHFVFMLHAHIPYVVSHGKWPHGTDCLAEAAAETYLPLLNTLNELENEGISPRLTIGITPILAEQLADPVFQNELSHYFEIKIKAAEEDSAYFLETGENHLKRLADDWIAFYVQQRETFEQAYAKNILNGFRDYLDKGFLEIITCGATHGYFPLIGDDACINLQVKTAVETHKKHFGKLPRRIWMPECAYRPGYSWKRPVSDGYSEEAFVRHGVEEFLLEHGIEYTFIDSHMLKGGEAIGVYADRFEGLRMLLQQLEKEHRYEEIKDLSPHELYSVRSSRSPDRSLTLFTHDPRTGIQVWSGEHGYPGDGWYLDFHKKRFPGGLRYWKVTSSQSGMGDKEVYNPDEIEKRLDENASHFVKLIHRELEEYHNSTGNAGVLTAPYDCELFGHWWFDGCRFIKKVFHKFQGSSIVTPATAGQALEAYPPRLTITIQEGSWGEDGFHYIWLNKNTEWTWRDIYRDEQAVIELVEKASGSDSVELRSIVTQAVRELLLEHASDWQFLISTFAARDYAEMRIAHHHSSVLQLVSIANRFIENGSLNDEEKFYLNELKEQDHPFGHLQLEWCKNLPDKQSAESS